MNHAIAQQIMDSKPGEAEHYFIDESDEIRDRHIETMFTDLFEDKPLDDIFTNNFGVYHNMLTKQTEPIDPEVFSNPDATLNFVSTNYGLVHTATIGSYEPGIHTDDPDFDHCRYVSILRSRYAPESTDGAYASDQLRSMLIAVVLVFRAVAKRHLDHKFAAAISG